MRDFKLQAFLVYLAQCSELVFQQSMLVIKPIVIIIIRKIASLFKINSDLKAINFTFTSTFLYKLIILPTQNLQS